MELRMSETAVEFLQQLRPTGPWVLVAIHPDTTSIEAVTVNDAEGVAAFVLRYDGLSNIYYSMNPTRGPMNIKPKKADIAAIEYICADLDPKKDESVEAAQDR